MPGPLTRSFSLTKSTSQPPVSGCLRRGKGGWMDVGWIRPRGVEDRQDSRGMGWKWIVVQAKIESLHLLLFFFNPLVDIWIR